MARTTRPESGCFFLTLDRVEDDLAVLVSDDGQKLLVPACLLPAGTREGHVMSLGLDPEPEETSARLDRVGDLRRRLLERSGGG